MIYLIRSGTFKNQGKRFSPASHFFVEDDNTVEMNGIKSDFIEEAYGRIETMAAKVFDKIRDKDDDYGLAGSDIPLLQFFAAELYWRLPAQRALADRLAETLTPAQLGIFVKDTATGERVHDLQFQAMMKKSPVYLKSIRTMLTISTYPRLFECTSPVTIRSFPKGLPAICSDNQLILRHPETFDPG